MSKQQKKIIIEGITAEGRKFRPSDWAERMSGKLATYKNHRIKYSPLLQPSMTAKGYKCILIDPKLEQTNQTLYQFLIDFAKKNQLNICDEAE